MMTNFFFTDSKSQKRKLSDYVHHYEALAYDTSYVHDQHQRHKRSPRQDEHKVNIQFASHGRDFELELQRDHSVFHNHIVVERGEDIGNILDFKILTVILCSFPLQQK